MKNIIFGTNWKMRMSHNQTTSYAHALLAELHAWDDQPSVFILPPNTLIQTLSTLLRDSPVLVGAQNFHWAAEGEFTGETSLQLLREAGAQIVMVGHSERRHLFHENTVELREKLVASTSHGVRTVLCVGESLADRRSGAWAQALTNEVRALFDGLTTENTTHIIVAYEPYWAIGVHGVPASTPEVEQAVATIRNTVQEFTHEAVPILYGGSVDEVNCAAIMAETSVNGLFVGRAALDANRFVSIMRRSLKERQCT